MPAKMYCLRLERRQNLRLDSGLVQIYRSRPNDELGSYLSVRSTLTYGYSCLGCLENLFGRAKMFDNNFLRPIISQTYETAENVALDGNSDALPVSRTTILNAAETLYVRPTEDVRRTLDKARRGTSMRIIASGAEMNDQSQHPESARSKTPTPPSTGSKALANTMETTKNASHKSIGSLLPFNYPSNSDQAIHLRDERRKAIDSTHRYLAHIAHRMDNTVPSHQSPSFGLPSMVLGPPADLPAMPDRYKKEGLTPSDRTLPKLAKAQGLVARGNSLNNTTTVAATTSKAVLEALSREEVYCYGREPDDHGGMVPCCAEFCQVGWVHLKCSSLPRLPENEETWYCRYCSSHLGPGTFDFSRGLAGEESDRDLTPELDGVDDTASDLPEEPTPHSDESITYERNFPSSDSEGSDDAMPGTPNAASVLRSVVTYTPHSFLDGTNVSRPELSKPHSQSQLVDELHSITPPKTSFKIGLGRLQRRSSIKPSRNHPPSTPVESSRRKSSDNTRHTPLPSRHVKSSSNDLAPFIAAQTRGSAAPLSIPQIFTLERPEAGFKHSELEVTDREIEGRPRRATPSESTKKNDRRQWPGSEIQIA